MREKGFIKMMKSYFSDREFFRVLFVLALPIALQNFLVSSVNTIDTLMVNALGVKEVAAVGIANQFYFVFNILAISISEGSGVFLSQFWGKKDVDNIKRVIGVGTVTVFVLGIIFCLSGLLVPNFIASLFSDDADVIRISSDYLRIVCLSYSLTAVTMIFSMALRSMGRASIPMKTSTIAILINIVLNYVLIFGKVGFPALGIRGAALATVIARVVEVCLILIAALRPESPIGGKLRVYLDLSFAFVRRVSATVIPVVLNDCFWGFGMVVYMVAYGKLGTNALASIQICNTIQNMFLVVCIGIASASLVITGNCIGSGDDLKARDYAYKLGITAFLSGLAIGAVLLVCAPFIVEFFRGPENVEEVISSSLAILRFYALTECVKAFNSTCIAGIMRGGGDAGYALKTEAFSMWCIGVPMSFLGAVFFKFHIEYVVMMVALEEVFKLVVCCFRLKSGKWLNNVVQTP